MFSRITLGLVFASVIALGATASPSFALTIDDVQNQIQQLLSRIADLTRQLNELRGQGDIIPPSVTPIQDGRPNWHRICGLIHRNLAQGYSGDDVMSLQEFLKTEGHMSAEATGFFGPMTAGAVAKWQAAEGVSAVGHFGPLSRERMRIWCGGNRDFNASPLRGPSPLTVTFAANVTYPHPLVVADAGTYRIDFGDGERADLNCLAGSVDSRMCGPFRGIQHTYAGDGTYTANLVHFGYYGVAPNERIVASIVIHVGPIACPAIYQPVCGSKPIVCITTPCNPIQQTYSNRCAMEADGATFLYEGVCRDSDGYRPPVISSFSGPTTLSVNQTGTWTINASDPENGQLSYSVDWGDVAYLFDSAPSAASLASFVQSTTFTHSYSSAGTYTVSITVQDASGQSARTSTTVQVGSVINACTLEYAPVCGSKTSCPGNQCTSVGNCGPNPSTYTDSDGGGTCTITQVCSAAPCSATQKTYSNRCFMGADGATFVHVGLCANTSVCWNAGISYQEGATRGCLSDSDSNSDGSSRCIADAYFVCRSGQWKTEGGLPNPVN